jgi:hypothetical protein
MCLDPSLFYSIFSRNWLTPLVRGLEETQLEGGFRLNIPHLESVYVRQGRGVFYSSKKSDISREKIIMSTYPHGDIRHEQAIIKLLK